MMVGSTTERKKERNNVRRKELPDITLLDEFFRIPYVQESTQSPKMKSQKEGSTIERKKESKCEGRKYP